MEGEILEGTLSCPLCQSRFPIRKGVPRFVQMDDYVDTFSFEWNRFHDVQIDWDVVGVNLSFAVDAAYGNVGKRENVHIVQADLFHLPFPEGRFNAMYSFGVLHQTRGMPSMPWCLPEARGEIRRLSLRLRALFVFQRPQAEVTTRVPYRIVYYLTSLTIPLYYLYKLPFAGLALRFFFPMSQPPIPRWRWLDTFDWYTPRYQHKHTWPEVYGWYLDQSFENISLNQETKEFSLLHINVRGTKTGNPY